MDTDKRRSLHRLKGTAVLEDKLKELSAWLLGRGISEEDLFQLHGITAEQLEKFRGDIEWQRRFAFVSKVPNQKGKRPKSHEAYKAFALKNLYILSKEGEADDRIKASVELAKLSHTFQKEGTTQQPAGAPVTGALADAFKGGE